jgi:hypothetical protein
MNPSQGMCGIERIRTAYERMRGLAASVDVQQTLRQAALLPTLSLHASQLFCSTCTCNSRKLLTRMHGNLGHDHKVSAMQHALARRMTLADLLDVDEKEGTWRVGVLEMRDALGGYATDEELATQLGELRQFAQRMEQVSAWCVRERVCVCVRACVCACACAHVLRGRAQTLCAGNRGYVCACVVRVCLTSPRYYVKNAQPQPPYIPHRRIAETKKSVWRLTLCACAHPGRAMICLGR